MDQDTSTLSIVDVKSEGIEKQDLDLLIKEIKTHKKNTALSFFEIGSKLKLIREEKLYKQKGFSSFGDFLKIPEVDFSSVIAERFIMMTDDPDLQKSLYIGASKMTEVLKLAPEHRKQLLSQPFEIRGEKKSLDEISLNELKKISQDFKRQGKLKCDRCGRWVDHLKELDGKFYGVGSKHSCYEQEVEERRMLQENAIPAEQLDNVLKDLKGALPKKEEIEEKDVQVVDNSLSWLPESIYQVYGQFLNEYKKNSEDISLESLQKEEEMIGNLMYLLKSRLKDIKETIGALTANNI